MKNVIFVEILVAASLLNGCKSAPAISHPQASSTQPFQSSESPAPATTPSSKSNPDIDSVRNGYLEYNKTTTIGQALEHTFQNGSWKSFTTDKGAKIVEFDGSAPFSHFRSVAGLESGFGAPEGGDCNANLICEALNNKITDDCASPAGQAQYVQVYQDKKVDLTARLKEVNRKQALHPDEVGPDNVLDAVSAELLSTENDLRSQLVNQAKPEIYCIESSYKKVSDDPIPISVQFSINHDGTFQYHANSMGWSAEQLFASMYE